MPVMTLYGISFECPAPYSAGHVLSEVESDELNRALADNVRNNLSKRAKDAPPAYRDRLAREFTEYAAQYKFTRRASDKPSALDREAQRIARATLRESLQRRGETRSDDEFEALVAQVAKSPVVLAEAERRVAKTLEIAQHALRDELG